MHIHISLHKYSECTMYVNYGVKEESSACSSGVMAQSQDLHSNSVSAANHSA